MKKFGQKLLADSLEVHNTHLNKIELGKKRPSTDLILKIANLFNVSVDQLMRDDIEIE